MELVGALAFGTVMGWWAFLPPVGPGVRIMAGRVAPAMAAMAAVTAVALGGGGVMAAVVGAVLGAGSQLTFHQVLRRRHPPEQER